MTNRFENLWESAAGDGALSPVGIARPECEIDALMDAWLRERQDGIECRLYLEEAGRLLKRIVCEERMPRHLRQRVKHLLLAIRAIREAERATPADED